MKKGILLYLCSGSNYLCGCCPGILQVPEEKEILCEVITAAGFPCRI